MTDEQAVSILNGLCAPFTKRLTDDERMVWLAALAEMDARQAVTVAILYGKQAERFPTLPEFRKAVRQHAEREEPKHDLHGNVPRSKPPAWVHRWIAARFLHAKFDRLQDMRRFPEQQDRMSPDVPLMPTDEWLVEAAQVSEADVWAAIPHTVKHLPEGA
jgi:hypothetical protein